MGVGPRAPRVSPGLPLPGSRSAALAGRVPTSRQSETPQPACWDRDAPAAPPGRLRRVSAVVSAGSFREAGRHVGGLAPRVSFWWEAGLSETVSERGVSENRNTRGAWGVQHLLSGV